jgi:hypothetical protein
VPAGLGSVLQFPATVALWWIDAVARSAATWPAPRLGAGAALPVGAALAWWCWSPAARRVVTGLVVLALAVLVVAGARSGPGGVPSLTGARWCPGGGEGLSVLVVEDLRSPAALVEDLLEAGVRRVDVVVLVRGGRAQSGLVAELGRVVDLGAVLAPSHHEVRGARRVTDPVEVPTEAGPARIDPLDRHTLSFTGPC